MAAERAELKQERNELKCDSIQFMKERNELIVENAALKKELEIRFK